MWKEGSLAERKFLELCASIVWFDYEQGGKKLSHGSHDKKQSSLNPLQIGEKNCIKHSFIEKT